MNTISLKNATKLNAFKQVDASTLSELCSNNHEVKLLPSSANYDWYASYDDVKDLVCNGEVITLGKARYANIKYYKGEFLSSNNVLVQSKNENIIRTKFLYYFLLKTKKDYYVEGTTYPKFDQTNFDSKQMPLYSINKQDEIINQLDYLFKCVEIKQNEIYQLDELIKSRFIEMFGDNYDTAKYPVESLGKYMTVLVDFNANGSYEKLDSNVTMYDEPNYAWMVRTTDLETKNYIDVKYIDKKAYDLLSKSKIFGDELIMSKIGSAGKIYLMPKINKPASLGRNAFMMRFDASKVNMKYLFHMLSTDFGTKDIMSRTRGAVTKTITKDETRNIKYIDAPIELQNEFGMFIELIDKSKFVCYSRYFL